MNETVYVYIVHSDINENNIYAEFETEEEAVDYAKRHSDELTYVDKVEVALDEYGDIIEEFDSETIWVYDYEDDLAESLKFSEEENKEFHRLCREIGIIDDRDLDNFKKEVGCTDDNILQALRDYRAELGPDFEIQEDIDFDGLVEALEENEDVVECKECFELFPKASGIKVEHGYVCPNCHTSAEGDWSHLDADFSNDFSDDDIFKMDFPEYKKFRDEDGDWEFVDDREFEGPNPQPTSICVGPECEAPVEAPQTKEEVINTLVRDEEEAIDQYNAAQVQIDSISDLDTEEKEKIKEVLDHIKEEEHEHIEELVDLVDIKEEPVDQEEASDKEILQENAEEDELDLELKRKQKELKLAKLDNKIAKQKTKLTQQQVKQAKNIKAATRHDNSAIKDTAKTDLVVTKKANAGTADTAKTNLTVTKKANAGVKSTNSTAKNTAKTNLTVTKANNAATLDDVNTDIAISDAEVKVAKNDLKVAKLNNKIDKVNAKNINNSEQEQIEEALDIAVIEDLRALSEALDLESSDVLLERTLGQKLKDFFHKVPVINLLNGGDKGLIDKFYSPKGTYNKDNKNGNGYTVYGRIKDPKTGEINKEQSQTFNTLAKAAAYAKQLSIAIGKNSLVVIEVKDYKGEGQPILAVWINGKITDKSKEYIKVKLDTITATLDQADRQAKAQGKVDAMKKKNEPKPADSSEVEADELLTDESTETQDGEAGIETPEQPETPAEAVHVSNVADHQEQPSTPNNDDKLKKVLKLLKDQGVIQRTNSKLAKQLKAILGESLNASEEILTENTSKCQDCGGELKNNKCTCCNRDFNLAKCKYCGGEVKDGKCMYCNTKVDMVKCQYCGGEVENGKCTCCNELVENAIANGGFRTEGYRTALASYDSDDHEVNAEFGLVDEDDYEVVDEEYLLCPGQTVADLVVYLSRECGFSNIYVRGERSAFRDDIKTLKRFKTVPGNHDYNDYGSIEDRLVESDSQVLKEDIDPVKYLTNIKNELYRDSLGTSVFIGYDDDEGYECYLRFEFDDEGKPVAYYYTSTNYGDWNSDEELVDNIEHFDSFEAMLKYLADSNWLKDEDSELTPEEVYAYLKSLNNPSKVKQQKQLYDIFKDGDYIGQLWAFDEDDAVNKCYNGAFGLANSDDMFEAELATELDED